MHEMKVGEHLYRLIIVRCLLHSEKVSLNLLHSEMYIRSYVTMEVREQLTDKTVVNCRPRIGKIPLNLMHSETYRVM